MTWGSLLSFRRSAPLREQQLCRGDTEASTGSDIVVVKNTFLHVEPKQKKDPPKKAVSAPAPTTAVDCSSLVDDSVDAPSCLCHYKTDDKFEDEAMPLMNTFAPYTDHMFAHTTGLTTVTLPAGVEQPANGWAWPFSLWAVLHDDVKENLDGTASLELPAAKKSRRAKAKERNQSEVKTTVILRHIPLNYTRRSLLELLVAEGFSKAYDFVYLPIDFRTGASQGFAFVNLVTHEDAVLMRVHFSGFNRWIMPSEKVCDAGWADTQGQQVHINKFRNNAVMHQCVSDEYKPCIFKNGIIIDFPRPSRELPLPQNMKKAKQVVGPA